MASGDVIAGLELATAGKIVFGDGTIARLGELSRAAAPDASTALLVTGRDVARRAAERARLVAAGFSVVSLTVGGEPTTDDARSGTALAREHRVGLVVAIGGGSAIDLGKAIAALAAHDGDPLDYLEVIGRGVPLTRASIPFVAAPTTAGTGAEVTKNAVLSEPSARVKVSLRSERMLPSVALIDPELTWSVPPAVTAATGLDAITQVIEPFVSIAATPFTDALARDAIPRGARAIRRAVARGDDAEARADMALTSLFGGLCLANAKLGAVHGLAGPIGGAVDAPHGAVCARLLSFAIEINLAALRERARDAPALARYDELARMITGDPHARADDAVRWARALATDLDIAPLSRYGITSADVPSLAERAERASSTKGNPIVLTRAELAEIVTRAL